MLHIENSHFFNVIYGNKMVVITSFLVICKPTGSLNMICDFVLKNMPTYLFPVAG